MTFTVQEWHTLWVPARSTRRGEETTGLSTKASFACVVGFLEARHRLLVEFEETASAGAIEPEIRHQMARPERSAELAHPLEASLHWLISAAALVLAVLGILSL